ncbi:hypothetical protein [Pseudoalteromonas sp. Z9A5]|uniref:hypothetical protein n=1 Tax=Pseudoalteromonas sp. Z9A5 TaxID=2686355 RepID=UPI00140D0D7E|nr:hypothetical protein [Pseudoalteromonas sp. Z9A5]
MSTKIMRAENLSLKERKELEIKCSNRLNWTDGGHWMGRGKAPNCHMKEKLNSKFSHTYTFPEGKHARRWNSEWEEAIRHAGYLATGVLTLATGFVYTGIKASTSVVISLASTYALGETQAIIEYPKMERGWSYEIIFEHEFTWSPHPYSPRFLMQTVTGVSRNHLGEQVQSGRNIVKYNLDQLPDGLGRLLASAPSRNTTSVYA